MTKILKLLFHLLIVRPLVLVVIGMNVRGRMNLPKKGPAILAANHNSHLDTLILQSLFPLSMQSNIRPVAAADYFMRYRWLAWFSVNVMGILPIQRKLSASSGDPLSGCIDALGDGQILIVFQREVGVKQRRSVISKMAWLILQKNYLKHRSIPSFFMVVEKRSPKEKRSSYRFL